MTTETDRRRRGANSGLHVRCPFDNFLNCHPRINVTNWCGECGTTYYETRNGVVWFDKDKPSKTPLARAIWRAAKDRGAGFGMGARTTSKGEDRVDGPSGPASEGTAPGPVPTAPPSKSSAAPAMSGLVRETGPRTPAPAPCPKCAMDGHSSCDHRQADPLNPPDPLNAGGWPR